MLPAAKPPVASHSACMGVIQDRRRYTCLVDKFEQQAGRKVLLRSDAHEAFGSHRGTIEPHMFGPVKPTILRPLAPFWDQPWL